MILTVLKVTGIVLLVILGLLIFILCLLVFVPIHYQFTGSFYSLLQAEASVKWRPVMLNAVISCKNREIKYVIRLFGQVIMTNTDEKVSWLGRKFFVFEDEAEDVFQKPEENTEEIGISQAEAKKHFEEESDEGAIIFKESSQRKIGGEREKISNRETLFYRMQKKIRVLRKKVHMIMDKLKEINKKKEALLKVYHSKRFELAKKDVIAYGREVFDIIKPDELEGLIRFGLDNPADTGQILGIISMVLPLYDEFLTVQPNFEEACLEGNLKGKGKIRLYSVLKLALKVIFNKNLIKVTKKVQTIIEA